MCFEAQLIKPIHPVLDIRGGDIKRDKAIIQYARKPGLAHNQRWKYKDGYIFSAASPHLVLDIRVKSRFEPLYAITLGC